MLISGENVRLGWRDAFVVLLLFAVSSLLYAALGVRYDATQLFTSMQFIDVALLKTRLLESLWYYHANPPLPNLYAGLALKWFGDFPVWYFSLCFHLLSLVVAFSVYALTGKLSSSRLAAIIATALLLFSPSFVLYQNWLFYEFPAMALLTVATLVLYRFVQTQSTKWCAAFFALLAALLLTRSLFHLAWMVLVAGVLAMLMWERRRQILMMAALPVLVVALWYGKNAYYFGSFSTSTWMGLGMSNLSTLMVPVQELEPLVKEGKLSMWALISRYESTPALFRTGQRPATGIPVLDNTAKANGWYNYNFRDLPAIDGYYRHDALVVMRTFPERYLHGLGMANRLYFSPTSMNMYFERNNRAAVRPMEAIFNPLLYGARAAPGALPQPHYGVTGKYRLEVNFSISLVLTWVAVIAFACVQAWKGLRDATPDSKARAIVMGFVAGTAVYLYLLSTMIEMAENYRYRFLIEPLMFVLAATAITAGVRRYRASVAARRSGELRATSA